MRDFAKIMGVPFPKLTLDHSVELISDVIERQSPELFHVVTGNPEILMSCQHDRSLRTIIDEAGLVTADGIGVVMVSRLRGEGLPERVTGCDLLLKLLEAGDRKKWSFYLLGADENTSRKAADVISRRYPNAEIRGRHHGFFDPSEDERIVQDVRAAGADVLVVALGAPYAERWIYKYRNELNSRIAIGVGGTLDVIAGKVPRAPLLWRKMNLEWLFRLVNQPSRWRRQLVLPRFAVKALLYREGKKA